MQIIFYSYTEELVYFYSKDKIADIYVARKAEKPDVSVLGLKGYTIEKKI